MYICFWVGAPLFLLSSTYTFQGLRIPTSQPFYSFLLQLIRFAVASKQIKPKKKKKKEACFKLHALFEAQLLEICHIVYVREKPSPLIFCLKSFSSIILFGNCTSNEVDPHINAILFVNTSVEGKTMGISMTSRSRRLREKLITRAEYGLPMGVGYYYYYGILHQSIDCYRILNGSLL